MLNERGAWPRIKRKSKGASSVVEREARRHVLVMIIRFFTEFFEPAAELLGKFVITRLAIEIVGLVRIALQIVKLVFLRVDEEVNVFVPLGANAAAGLDILRARIFVIFVEQVFTPRNLFPLG